MTRTRHFIPLIALALAGVAQALMASQPVKLDVQADRQSVGVGDPVTLTATLLDAENRPAPAPRKLVLLVQRRQASQQPEKLAEATLAAGASSVTIKVSINSTGMYYLWVKNPELLPGGVNVAVRQLGSGARTTPAPAPPPPPQRARRLTPANPMTLEMATGAEPTIALRTSPDRVFLADGHDLATVEAFLLTPDSASTDLKLNIFDSAGSLNPSPLVIPRGQSVGLAHISAAQPGTYSVELLSSDPKAALDGSGKIDVHFGPPITQLQPTASPPQVSLLDHANIIVRLSDEGGKPVATDTPRVISLALVEGKGEIHPDQITIPAGQFEARSVFYPSSRGSVRISASTANLMTREVEVPVRAPWMLVGISAVGGLLGGYLVVLRKKKPQAWKAMSPMLLTGLVTGLILYWACIFLGLASVTSGAILNPFNAFAFSVIGGWLQTEVFGMVTKRF